MVSELSQVGEVRREVNRLATRLAWSDDERGKAALIATELATNLARYAKGGELLVRTYTLGGLNGLEFLSIDRGPGVPLVARCLDDGYSTGGTAGNGLGAIRRMASEFDMYSTQPAGTVVLARLQHPPARAPLAGRLVWGSVNRPAPGETTSGDTWRIVARPGWLGMLVADGLGHGPQAAEPAEMAAALFESQTFATLAEYLQAAHVRLRGSRGAAIAVASINLSGGVVAYAGIGNIAGTIRSGATKKGRGLVSHNGTVGVEMRKVQSFDYELAAGELLVMHSDGLQSRWSLDTYPGLSERHPAIVAAVLYRDYCRGRDDVTVCVIRRP